jgi:beta-mannosidase
VSDAQIPPPSRAHPRISGDEVIGLTGGWQAVGTRPDACAGPAQLDGLAGWRSAAVPGTAAGISLAATTGDIGEGSDVEAGDLDAQDWWFRTRFDAPAVVHDDEVELCLDGLATICEVYLNGEHVLTSDSMFVSHRVAVGERLRDSNELVLCCRALAPLLAQQRRPRARWRTRLVTDGTLRFFRTMLLGRMPGSAPGPPAVGPWRPVYLHCRRAFAVDELSVRTRVQGEAGFVAVAGRLRSLGPPLPHAIEVQLTCPAAVAATATLAVVSEGGRAASFSGEVVVADPALWWPHTHGQPALYDVSVRLATDAGQLSVDAGRVGFRTLASGPQPGHNVTEDGLSLHINGVHIFARGALWTPLDLVGLSPNHARLRDALVQARDAGMNMIRIPGTGAYETPAFHDLCDELGILVWQDFMFANMDYPISDEHFRQSVRREATQVLQELAGRPSLAVLCGNSEVEQQASMLGLDPALGRGELFDELLPSLLADSGADAAYVPSAPCGDVLPFRTNAGIANYFGVGGYRRPLDDARRAEVRFASECLAISNVPEAATVRADHGDRPAAEILADPSWKRGVPHDVGTDWDFEDVRDHYLASLYGVDGAHLRDTDPERYLTLSREVSGEIMAAVFGEWRRAQSQCGGGLVLWLTDVLPGAGWGLVDHLGEPKAAWHHLRRVWAPVAVWTTDEGLNGVLAHVANDGPTAIHARLRVALYSDFQLRVGDAEETLDIPAHGSCHRDLEAMLGRFVDAAFAYRFGPPAQNLIVVTLQQDAAEGGELLSQAFHFPVGRPAGQEPLDSMGLSATVAALPDGAAALTVGSRRLAYGVRVEVPGFVADDDAFCVEPGGERTITLRPRGRRTAGEPATGREPGATGGPGPTGGLELAGKLTATNLAGVVPVVNAVPVAPAATLEGADLR